MHCSIRTKLLLAFALAVGLLVLCNGLSILYVLQARQLATLRPVLAQPDAEVQAAMRLAMLVLAAGSVAGLLLAVVLVILLDRDIGQPLKGLAEMARHGAAEGGVTFNLSRSDEIGLAAEAIEEMVTALRQADEELAQKLTQRALAAETSVQQSQQIAEAFPEAILIANVAGTILVSNAAANRIAGASLLGRNVAESPRFLPSPGPQPLVRALHGEATVGLETLLQRESGHLTPVLLNVTPLFDGGRISGILGVFQDVTRINREKEEFLDSVLRELQPWFELARFRVEQMQSHVEKADPIDPVWLRKRLDEAQLGLRQIGDLADRLVDYLRLRSGSTSVLERHRTDLVALARSCIVEMGTIAAGHTIQLRSEPKSLEGDWDAAQLRRAITRLIRNALNRTLRGGAITVIVEQQVGGPDDTWAELRVSSEQGVGIEDQRLTSLLGGSPTEQDGDLGRDAGLGIRMMLVRQIVQQHGGSLSVENEEGFGLGATFTIRLPLHPAATPPAQ